MISNAVLLESFITRPVLVQKHCRGRNLLECDREKCLSETKNILAETEHKDIQFVFLSVLMGDLLILV